MSETTKCTMVFDCDIRKFEGNPFHAETPFGKPGKVQIGDVMAELDMANEELDFIMHEGGLTEGVLITDEITRLRAALKEAEERADLIADQVKEDAAKVADRHAEQNAVSAKETMLRASKLRRVGDPFGHGDMASEAAQELTAAHHEALAIAAAIRAMR